MLILVLHCPPEGHLFQQPVPLRNRDVNPGSPIWALIAWSSLQGLQFTFHVPISRSSVTHGTSGVYSTPSLGHHKPRRPKCPKHGSCPNACQRCQRTPKNSKRTSESFCLRLVPEFQCLPEPNLVPKQKDSTYWGPLNLLCCNRE